jgi:hypothetical protein
MACAWVMVPASSDCIKATPLLLGRIPSTAKMAKAWLDAHDSVWWEVVFAGMKLCVFMA